MRRRAAALGAFLAGLACAWTAAGQDGPLSGLNVFISPFGEPFRAAAHDPYPLDAWFNGADSNHDGSLSEGEFVADAARFFRRIDLNGDGVVDGGEITAYEQNTAPEILPHVVGLTARDIPPLPKPRTYDGRPAQTDQQQQAGQPRRRAGPAVDGAGFYSLIQEAEPVAAADTDFDGKVTLEEFRETARRKFDELDLNHDGQLERSELKKTDAERLAEKEASRQAKEDHRQRSP